MAPKASGISTASVSERPGTDLLSLSAPLGRSLTVAVLIALTCRSTVRAAVPARLGEQENPVPAARTTLRDLTRDDAGKRATRLERATFSLEG